MTSESDSNLADPSRSDIAHRSEFCQNKTNLLEPVWFYGGLRYRCPVPRGESRDLSSDTTDNPRVAAQLRKQQQLEYLVHQNGELVERFDSYGPLDTFQKNRLESLQKMVETIEARIAGVQAWYGSRVDHVADTGDYSPRKQLDGFHARTQSDYDTGGSKV